MKRAQQGFTLIELLIVVAIIGILAAIAIPAYQDYVAKSQASEAFSLLDGYKTPIAANVGELGDAGCAQVSGAVSTGKYVSGTTVSGTANACAITSTFAATGPSAKIISKRVRLTYDNSNGSFACATDLPTEIRPKACTTTLP